MNYFAETALIEWIGGHFGVVVSLKTMMNRKETGMKRIWEYRRIPVSLLNIENTRLKQRSGIALYSITKASFEFFIRGNNINRCRKHTLAIEGRSPIR